MKLKFISRKKFSLSWICRIKQKNISNLRSPSCRFDFHLHRFHICVTFPCQYHLKINPCDFLLCLKESVCERPPHMCWCKFPSVHIEGIRSENAYSRWNTLIAEKNHNTTTVSLLIDFFPPRNNFSAA